MKSSNARNERIMNEFIQKEKSRSSTQVARNRCVAFPDAHGLERPSVDCVSTHD